MEHKLCSYIERYGGVEYDNSIDLRSHYYTFWHRKIRISDHLSKNAPGCEYQIIIKNDNYVLYHVPTGTVNVCNYNEIKTFVRCFKFFTMYGACSQEGVTVSTRTILGGRYTKFYKSTGKMYRKFY